jgi:hypothetical protein
LVAEIRMRKVMENEALYALFVVVIFGVLKVENIFIQDRKS